MVLRASSVRSRVHWLLSERMVKRMVQSVKTLL